MKTIKQLRKTKINKNDKINMLLFCLIAFITLSFTVGYAALNDELKISGEAVYRVKAEIRVTNLELAETTNGGLENYRSTYKKDSIKTGIQLNQIDSTVKYKVEVTNFGNAVMTIDDITPSLNNSFMTYEIEEFQLKDMIYPGEIKTFYVKFYYNSSVTVVPNSTTLDCSIKFNFIRVKSVLAEAGINNINDIFSSGVFNNSNIQRTKVESIKFSPNLIDINTCENCWDASNDNSGLVVAQATDSDSNGLYELVISGAGEVYAPENSSYLFTYFYMLKKIEFDYVDNGQIVNVFNTSDVTNMSYMFSVITGLESLNLSGFNTQKVSNMSYMFYYCVLTDLDLSSFNTENVTDMSYMFNGAKYSYLDLSSFNTENVLNMSYMFQNLDADTLKIDKLDAKKVKTTKGMFQESKITNLDLSKFYTQDVTDMSYMFYNCNLTDLDLSGFNTQNAIDMSWMFYNCSFLTNLNLSSFDTISVTNMHYMFTGCSSLTSIDLNGFNTQNVTDMIRMFERCSSLKSLNLSNFDTISVTNMDWMFYGCSSLSSIDFGKKFDTSNITAMDYLFYGCSSLKSLDLSNFDTSNVTRMDSMFEGCTLLESINFGEKFDVSKVTNMESMFESCSSFTTLDLSCFVLNNISNMGSMFRYCIALESINFNGKFNIANNANMYAMFDGCSSLTNLDLSGFNVSAFGLQGMNLTFNGCSNLETLNISNFTIASGIVTTSTFSSVPASALITVKSQNEKDIILNFRSDFTNIQIASEV